MPEGERGDAEPQPGEHSSSELTDERAEQQLGADDAARRTKHSSGKLFVVGTPIGNLEDLSPRAARVLREVAVVAAEDTRHTRGLLSHLGIHKKPLVSIESHQPEARLRGLVERMVNGEALAVVTDAGMPGVSDPGGQLVRLARQAGVPVESVPGPSAVTTAVACSGLVEGPFRFVGFLPRKGAARRAALRRVFETEEPVVLFEAPSRATATLTELASEQPARRGSVGRELTKLHEEFVDGTLAELAQRESWRGELTLVLGAYPRAASPVMGEATDALIEERLAQGARAKELASEIAELTGGSRRDLYQRILELRLRR